MREGENHSEWQKGEQERDKKKRGQGWTSTPEMQAQQETQPSNEYRQKDRKKVATKKKKRIKRLATKGRTTSELAGWVCLEIKRKEKL